MKKALFQTGLLLAFISGLAHAQPAEPHSRAGNLGLGIMFGDPTGFTAKYWMRPNSAVDFALGFPFDSDVNFSMHGDYLWQIPLNLNVPGRLPFYFGLGARLRSIDKPHESQKLDFGVRFPLGMEFSPTRYPVNIFAELAPVAVFTPKGGIDLDGGFGVRYRF